MGVPVVDKDVGIPHRSRRFIGRFSGQLRRHDAVDDQHIGISRSRPERRGLAIEDPHAMSDGGQPDKHTEERNNLAHRDDIKRSWNCVYIRRFDLGELWARSLRCFASPAGDDSLHVRDVLGPHRTARRTGQAKNGLVRAVASTVCMSGYSVFVAYSCSLTDETKWKVASQNSC
jgi:hypothetical protein